jgi:type IV secretory pathway TraG/TraD family ATPase VirD4
MVFLIATQAVEAMKAWATVIGLIFLLLISIPIIRAVFGIFAAEPKKKKYKEVNAVDNFKLVSTADKVILDNPFRGIFISGGAGSGKSKSIIEPIIQQAGQKNYAGILYDFKFPTLAWEVNGSYPDHGAVKKVFVNFTDLNLSHQINPIDAKYIKNAIYAREAALTLLSNLDPKALEKRDFWIQSAESILTGTILFLRNNYPQHCTLPHVVSLILESKPIELISLLQKDEEVSGIIASIKSATGSENTLASMFATIQNYLSILNTKENFWVLCRSDFELDLNNPDTPTMLVVGNDDSISKSLSPVIALIISQALKHMNKPNRQKSILILDEAPTINLPNFAHIPATARASKIATVYAVQDLAQMESELGKPESEKILSNLANQFYGRTTNTATAERVSKLFGEFDKEIKTYSKGKSQESSKWISATYSNGSSTSVQRRKVLEPSEVTSFKVGTFAAVLTESNHDTKVLHLKGFNSLACPLLPIYSLDYETIKVNFSRIKAESKRILDSGI